MANFHGATALTGGGSGALDAIDGAILSDLDAAIVITLTGAYVYSLDDDSGASESSPTVIAPDTNPGDKRWILVSFFAAGLDLTNITDGKVPYIGASGAADSPISTDGTLVTIANAMSIGKTAYFASEVDNGNSGTSDSIDWTLGNKQKGTLTGDVTYTFSSDPAGPCSLTLRLIQDGTGGRDVTWPASVKWLGTEPNWASGGASKTIIVSFLFDGTNYWAQGTAWEV